MLTTTAVLCCQVGDADAPMQARLALYGREKDDDVPLASVREEHTWVSGGLSSSRRC